MNKNKRYLIIKYSISILFFLIIIKLFSIQIINQELKKYAKNNVIRKKIFQPNRGLIYDIYQMKIEINHLKFQN